MKRYRRSLPPLDTLVFFESAMRHLSFTRAATELMVSQAAVSKRIRQLEDWLGVALFERDGRRLRPTQAGRRLAERVGMTLDFLDQTVAGIRAPLEPVVTIGAMSSVAMFWLQPRLRAFSLGPDACAFNLISSDVPAEILSSEYDLALVYGDGVIPGWATERVLPEHLVPVASPAVAAVLGDVTAGAAMQGKPPLLDYPRRGPDWIDWSVWLRRPGHDVFKDWPRRPCSSYMQTIGMALDSAGVALGSRPLLDDEITAGRLVPLLSTQWTTGKAYVIAHPQDRTLSEEATRLRDALLGRERGSGARSEGG